MKISDQIPIFPMYDIYWVMRRELLYLQTLVMYLVVLCLVKVFDQVKIQICGTDQKLMELMRLLRIILCVTAICDPHVIERELQYQ
jgi:hypothetical protein